jgi:medium-chain acyl-[acyl-carrier-protein] hydrolase
MTVPPVYRRWVTCPQPRPQASLRLFCFHFAGGDASIYRLWTTQLPTTLEVCPIELPGRATRRAEPPITEFPTLIDTLARRVQPFLKDRPFAFFGHSFGGVIAFELTRTLRRLGAPLPVRLFLSACPALHARPRAVPPISHLPDTEFLEQISLRFGTPRDVLVSDEVRDSVLPALRADLFLAENYQYVPEAPLQLPLSSFGATEDATVSAWDIQQWGRQTTADFRSRMFPGNHFYLTAERPRLYQALLEDLALPSAAGGDGSQFP